MEWLLEEALEQGAWGYSTGLEYATEVGASEDEVGDLCRVVAAQGGLYSTHTRNRDEGAVAAVEEAIRTAEQSGVRLQISHLTPRSGAAPTERAIDLVDAARSRRVDVAFDMHTRLFGTTHLKALLPPWALDGGVGAVRRRLEHGAARDRMKSFRSVITALADWGRVVLLDHPIFPRLSRRSFADIALELGKDPLDCAYDILLADVEQLQRPMVIIHSYTEELLALSTGAVFGHL
jgi:N-acyl-D-amino-acid deacylase